jgi:hypothetical protein
VSCPREGIDFSRDRQSVEYVREHNVPPATTVSQEWRNINQWLQKRGTSLRNVMGSLGVRSRREIWSGVLIKQFVDNYIQMNGKRPARRSCKEANTINAFLSTKGSSLAKWLDENGYTK